MANKLKLLVSYCSTEMDGSAFHRVHVPSVMLSHENIDVTHVNDILDLPEERLTEFDAVLVNRQLTNYGVHPDKGNPLIYHYEAMRRVKASGIRLIVDIDDHWNVGKTHPHYQFRKQTKQTDAVMSSIREANLIWCSTPALADAIKNIALCDIHHIPNGISRYDAQWAEVSRQTSPKIRLGIVCNQTHMQDLSRLRASFERMRFLDNWHVVALGTPPPFQAEVIKALGTDRIDFRPWFPPTAYAEHYDHIDVMLCPLAPTFFNKFRSDIKVAECAFAGISVLCDNWGGYKGSDYVVNNWEKELPNYMLSPVTLLSKIPRTTDHSTFVADELRLRTINELIRQPCSTK